jgi:hypothetical protein
VDGWKRQQRAKEGSKVEFDTKEGSEMFLRPRMEESTFF